jgi:hypothetical protein
MPALRLTSKQDEKMPRKLNDAPRFESFDFGFNEKQFVPMRIGERIAGSVRISFGKHIHKLHLGAGESLKLRVKRFRAHDSSCFQCPTCRKWRKRLFLREIVSDQGSDLTYKLQCWECEDLLR